MGRTGRDGPSAASLPPICEEEIVASAEEGGVKAIPLAASDGGGHDDGNGDGTALPGTSDPSPIYLTSDAGASWELTWPIWHLLSHAERKDIEEGKKEVCTQAGGTWSKNVMGDKECIWGADGATWSAPRTRM